MIKRSANWRIAFFMSFPNSQSLVTPHQSMRMKYLLLLISQYFSMKSILRFTLIFLVVVSGFTVKGQQSILIHYSLDDGLPQSSVLTIYQDYTGNIWLGTQGGVTKYNGNSFENFDTRHGLGDNHITSILQDSRNRYWFGHRYKGLTVKIQDSLIHLHVSDDQINAICEDHSGNIWLGTYNDGIILLPAEKELRVESFKNPDVNANLPSGDITDIKLTQTNQLLIASMGGLTVLQTDQTAEHFSFRNFTDDNSGLPIASVISIAHHDDHHYWLLGYEGLVLIEITESKEMKVLEFYPFDPGISVTSIQNIIQDPSGVVWGAHELGVFRFENGEFDYEFRGTGFYRNETNTVFVDREENIWIGTMNLGVFKYPGDKFMLFDDETGLPSNVVTSVMEDNQKNLWISTEKGVGIYDGKKFDYLTTSEGLPHNSVDVLFQDSRGFVWLGFYSEGPLVRYNPQTGKMRFFDKRDGMITQSVLAINEDINGNVWFATLKYGVSEFIYNSNNDNGSFKTYTQEDGLCSNKFWVIHRDEFGNLWFGSDDKGLTKYDGQNFKIFNETDGLTNLSTGAITHDSHNNLWIASIGGGIFKFDGNEFSNLNIEDGLSSDSPFSILCDEKDYIWIGTNSGLDRLDPVTETFKHYGVDEGFLGIENNQNAACVGDNGVLWFGTMNGVVKFNTRLDRMNAIPPITVIEDIRLFFEENDFNLYTAGFDLRTGLPQGLELPYTKNHLTFDYVGISHIAPDKIRYRVKLENFDDDWNPLTKTTATTYTNIPPGTYTFKVKSANNDGVWNVEPTTITFTILPPLWQTVWFRALMILLLGGITYFIFWWRFKSIREQKVRLEMLVSEKTLELQTEAEERRKAQVSAEQADKLKTAFLANMSHEIRTPVNSIIGFADLMKEPDLDPIEQQTYLQYITNGGNTLLKLINDIIDISKIEAGQVKVIKEECYLDTMFSELFLTFHEHIKNKNKEAVSLTIPKDCQNRSTKIVTDPTRLKQILSNLINNAIKFTDTGEVEFGYRIDFPDKILFYVKDTGIGIPADKLIVIFQRFRQVEETYTRNFDGTGLGLAISKKLTQLLGGEMWVESEVGKGSTFFFTLPYDTEVDTIQQIDPSDAEVNPALLEGKNILVVEDEFTNFMLIESIFRSSNVHLKHVTDGDSAVRIFEKNNGNIDVILMDIKVPGLNGYEATREIRKLNQDVPIIAQTAYAMADERQKCLDAGCTDYIAKPYTKMQLLNVIVKNLMTEEVFHKEEKQ